jgi:hypothetical protein
VVCHLIIEGYIKEDFHFTPYSTIRYRYRVLYYRWNFRKKALIIIPVQALKMGLFPERRVVISRGNEQSKYRKNKVISFLGIAGFNPDLKSLL